MNKLGVKKQHFTKQLGQKITNNTQKLGQKISNVVVKNQPLFRKIDHTTSELNEGLRFIPVVSSASGITSAVAHLVNKSVTAKKNSLEKNNPRKKAIEMENAREMRSAVMPQNFY